MTRFKAAESYHSNFYQNRESVRGVQQGIDAAREFVAILERLRQEPRPEFEIKSESDRTLIRALTGRSAPPVGEKGVFVGDHRLERQQKHERLKEEDPEAGVAPLRVPRSSDAPIQAPDSAPPTHDLIDAPVRPTTPAEQAQRGGGVKPVKPDVPSTPSGGRRGRSGPRGFPSGHNGGLH